MISKKNFKIKIQDQIVEKELLESQIEKLNKNIEEINTSRTYFKSRIEHYKELIDRETLARSESDLISQLEESKSEYEELKSSNNIEEKVRHLNLKIKELESDKMKLMNSNTSLKSCDEKLKEEIDERNLKKEKINKSFNIPFDGSLPKMILRNSINTSCPYGLCRGQNNVDPNKKRHKNGINCPLNPINENLKPKYGFKDKDILNELPKNLEKSILAVISEIDTDSDSCLDELDTKRKKLDFRSKNNNYKTVNFPTDNHSECSAIDQIGHNNSDEDQVVGIFKSRGKANGRMVVRQGPYGGIYYEIPHSFIWNNFSLSLKKSIVNYLFSIICKIYIFVLNKAKIQILWANRRINFFTKIYKEKINFFKSNYLTCHVKIRIYCKFSGSVIRDTIPHMDFTFKLIHLIFKLHQENIDVNLRQITKLLH
ncbi:hypothetical protein BpHYR1_049858 [Brachionus plicatilis]|uniref:Uncharacterized protein n=1 Tax=Brachionus plicatilis TaxID=10195 RepID=A0A3M7STW4_BRAPC|nr:hypothetical protein BpHYR1_049858 [Brachionus plicatilis]